MKKAFSITAGSLLTLFASYAASNTYRITAYDAPAELDGKACFLLNALNEKLDSTAIKNGRLSFEGTVDTPQWVHLELDGEQIASFVLEPGDITISESDYVTGGIYNNTLRDLYIATDSLRRLEYFEENEAERERIRIERRILCDSVFQNNIDNPVGHRIFFTKVILVEPADLYAEVAKYPQMRQDPSIQQLLKLADNKLATMPGKKFVDFAVTTESGTQSLSDYVGKGKPVLVDFWASWCGPCIRETALIRELLAEYGDKGLEVVGVAVWDKPEDTLAALEQHKFPWPQIVDAQRIPSEIYGFSQIPFILLIAPDGTIVSRDLHGDELRHSVKELMDSLTVQ